VYGFTVNT